ncbi:MAG: sugar phosphate isomerase/epimerase family protein [Armatimonadota bacterium]
MKISFMTFVAPEWSLEENLTAAIRYGYDAIEPRCEADHNHGVELDTTKKQRAEIKDQFESCGVALTTIATSRRYALASDHELQESIDLTKQYCDLCADLGAENIRVFGGMTPEGMEFEDAKKTVAEALHECGEYAAQAGVYLCIETHDAYCNSADVLEVVRSADSKGVAINWDVMHPFRFGESMETAFNNVKDHVRHCHIHDGVRPDDGSTTGWEIALMGEGDIPHDEAIKLLATIDYDGSLSGEWIRSFYPETILPHDAQVLREYIAAAE